jgi:uncharacterized protein
VETGQTVSIRRLEQPMKVFALSDPHLSFDTPGKEMDVFGPEWDGHPEVMARRWRETVAPEDIVLVSGDISWARRLEGAAADLAFLASLPGRKVLVRGNHDYWWASPSKIRAALPEGIFIIQNDAVTIDGVSIAGTRLWDDPEIRFPPMDYRPRTREPGVVMAPPKEPADNEKILLRELHRLKLSLDGLDSGAVLRIVMFHYPPTSPDLAPSRSVGIIEEAGVDICVFGHLHGLLSHRQKPLFGERKGVRYLLTSCDYLDFCPLEIASLPEQSRPE